MRKRRSKEKYLTLELQYTIVVTISFANIPYESNVCDDIVGENFINHKTYPYVSLYVHCTRVNLQQLQ